MAYSALIHNDEMQILETINYACESLSIIGSLFIVISFSTFPRLRNNFAYALVFYVAIADLLRSAAKITGSCLPNDGTPQILCSISAFFINFASLVSFLFVASIAFIMHTIANIKWASFWNVSAKTLQKRKFYIVITVVIIAAIFSSFPFFQNAYVHLGPWCWIDENTQHWRWICYYIPMILIFDFCVIVYGIIVWKMHKLEQEMKDQSLASRRKFAIFRRLKYYPMVLLICFLFPTVHRFYEIFNDDVPFWLLVLHVIGSGSYGFLNGIVYGINQMVTEEYKICLKKRYKPANPNESCEMIIDPERTDSKGNVMKEGKSNAS